MFDLDYIDGYIAGFYASFTWNPGGPWTDRSMDMNAARDRWLNGFRAGRLAR